MKLEISLGMAYKAKRAAGRREPLRTVSELADEFGVTKEGLGKALAQPGAPQRPVASLQVVPVAQATQGQLGRQRPLSQCCRVGHSTPAQGSTQPPPRHTCPTGQRASAHGSWQPMGPHT